jgi:hypothetical protein
VGVPLNCIGTINGAGNYTNYANTLPLAWNEGGNARWGIAVGYAHTWLGPTTQNSPLGVYTCAGQPSYTVVASAPTDATIQADVAAAAPTVAQIQSGLATASALAIVAAAVSGNPAAVVAALIAAGVLQYVSGSSGPLQFTTTAVANVPTPNVVNISTEDTIEEHNPRREDS